MTASDTVPPLDPTLWRTCRVLANRTRLRLLRQCIDSGGSNSVSSLAASAGLPLPTATIYLRQLNSRGLLTANRSGRWVRYRFSADPSIPGNRDLVAGLRHTFRSDHDPVETIFKAATAFTHPRRIRIVKELKLNGTLTIPELQSRTRFSIDALKRHLKKLADRGVITINDQDLWRLRHLRLRLLKTLVSMAVAEG